MAGVVAVVVLAMVGLCSARVVSAQGAGDPEVFRQELLQFIDEMYQTAVALKQAGGPDRTAQLAEARQQVRTLPPDPLAILQRAFSTQPNWRDLPGILQGLLAPRTSQRLQKPYALNPGRLAKPVALTLDSSSAPLTGDVGFTLMPGRPAIVPAALTLDSSSDPHTWNVGQTAVLGDGGPWDVVPVITPDDCATARAAGITATDVEIAADVALAADVILEAIPQDTLDEIVRVIAVVAWAIPQGVLRGFQHQFNIASACDDADHQALVTQNLDVKVSTLASQASITSLSTSVTNVTTSLTNLRSDVDTSFTNVTTSLTTLKSDVDNSFTNVTTNLTTLKSDVDNSFTNVNTELTTLQTSVNNVQGGTNQANASLGVLQTSVNTANTNILTLTTNVAALQGLSVRLHIEEDLANPGNHPVGLFQLPAAQGGFLETARSIVADIIQKTLATGQGVGNAQAFLARGDQLAAGSRFKDAYTNYGNAYRAATD